MCWDRVIETETKKPEQAKRITPPVRQDEAKAPTAPEPSRPPVTEDVPALAEARG